jgi:lipid II:glycine glycyltransferase (peptidoglycan interpeptide bridge formation enzyme)
MISTLINKCGIKLITTWFYDGTELKVPCDVAVHIEAINKPETAENNEFTTLVVDLTKNEEELFGSLDKQCRQLIRRARREGIKFEYLNSSELSNEKLNKYIDYYNKFAQYKNINACQDSLLKQLRDNNSLSVCCAIYENEILACNIYASDDTYTRHIYSASLLYDPEIRNLVGRANRMLHWEAMLNFKNLAIKYYDMGGISYDEEIVNITHFKLEFGGEVKKYYSYIQLNTLKGKIYNKAINFIDNLNKHNKTEFYKKKQSVS